MAAVATKKLAGSAATVIPKSVQDVDLYLARSLVMLKYNESSEPFVKSDPQTVQQMLAAVIASDKYIDELIDSITPSERSKIFLKNVTSIWNMRKKYVAAGKLPVYEPTFEPFAGETQKTVEDIRDTLLRTGSTVLSSDYTWNPDHAARLPELIKSLEESTGSTIKLETIHPSDAYLHREKKMYFDSQLWISLQIQPAIKISLDKSC